MEMGIATGAELAAQPEAWLRRHLGGVVGQRLWHELHGHPCLDWNPGQCDENDEFRPASASCHTVAHTRSFDRPRTRWPLATGPVYCQRRRPAAQPAANDHL